MRVTHQMSKNNASPNHNAFSHNKRAHEPSASNLATIFLRLASEKILSLPNGVMFLSTTPSSCAAVLSPQTKTHGVGQPVARKHHGRNGSFQGANVPVMLPEPSLSNAEKASLSSSISASVSRVDAVLSTLCITTVSSSSRDAIFPSPVRGKKKEGQVEKREKRKKVPIAAIVAASASGVLILFQFPSS